MLLALLSQLFNFCRAISYLPLHIRLPLSFSLPSSTSTVWVIIRKAADSDKSLSEKAGGKKPNISYLYCRPMGTQTMALEESVQLSVPLKISGGWSFYLQATSFRWSGSSLPPSHATHLGPWRPYGCRTPLSMLVPVCHSTTQPQRAFLLKLSPPSSYRFPAKVWTERGGTGKSCSCVQSCQV